MESSDPKKTMIKKHAKVPRGRSAYRQFADEQTKLLAAKYPFLTSHQVKKKARQQWDKLPPQVKSQYAPICSVITGKGYVYTIIFINRFFGL